MSQYQFIYSILIFNFNFTHAPISIYLSVYKFHSTLLFLHFTFVTLVFLSDRTPSSAAREGRRAIASRLPESAATFVRLLLLLFYPLLNFLFTRSWISVFTLLTSLYHSIYCFTIFTLPVHKLQVLFYTLPLSIYLPPFLVHLLFYLLLNLIFHFIYFLISTYLPISKF